MDNPLACLFDCLTLPAILSTLPTNLLHVPFALKLPREDPPMATSYLFLFVLLLCLLWLVWFWHQHRPPQSDPAAVKPTRQRLLKPRTPDDYPHCRQERASPIAAMPTHPLICPWSEVKSHRGRPKQIDTQGYACENPACTYFGIIGASVGLNGTNVL